MHMEHNFQPSKARSNRIAEIDKATVSVAGTKYIFFSENDG
jgi:hypothetical protein